MRHWLIEGWRGVNHSLALVNQHQILALRLLPGLRLYHRDVPLLHAHWRTDTHAAGFSADQQACIDALGEPPGPPGGDTGQAINTVYRIATPLQAPTRRPGRQTFTFVVTEFGLSASDFKDGVSEPARFTGDGDLVVTPSRWSRDRLLELGFAPERVKVVPHGVDSSLFHPLAADERSEGRRGMAIAPDEFVFLNVGTAMWNKGHDLLLQAFAVLRQRGCRVRLILKDQPGLFGVSVRELLNDAIAAQASLFPETTLQAISLVPANLSLHDLRFLYGVADAYVSPYRAEGFNLPVLEALACGTPVIVTRGGATDDFCPPAVASGIDSDLRTHSGIPTILPSRLCEPRLDSLIHAMAQHIAQPWRYTVEFEAARAVVINQMSWPRAVQRLLAL